MKTKIGTILTVCGLFGAFTIISCGGGDKPKSGDSTSTAKVENTPTETAEPSKDKKMETGKAVYTKVCIACHQADGKGVKGAFPPLAASDYLAADIKRAIHGAANGLKGEITVNGEKYNAEMPKPNPDLSDEELASVFTYVLNNFGNKGGEVSIKEASEARK